jgi:ferredoxin
VAGEKEGDVMPRIDMEGVGAVEVSEGKRPVLAIEEDVGVNVLHRCGGYARCTTCRIEYPEGEPEKMPKANLEVLERKDLLGRARLSLQAVGGSRRKGATPCDGEFYGRRETGTQAGARDYA